MKLLFIHTIILNTILPQIEAPTTFTSSASAEIRYNHLDHRLNDFNLIPFSDATPHNESDDTDPEFDVHYTPTSSYPSTSKCSSNSCSTLPPIIHPTTAPIEAMCESNFNSKTIHNQHDFIILYDNSCGLQPTECNVMLDNIGEIIMNLLYYPNTRIQTMEFNSNGINNKVLISFNSKLQYNRLKYVEYFKKHAMCTNGAENNKTDLTTTLLDSVQYFNLNDDRMDKIIIISACKDAYHDKQICGKIAMSFNKLRIDSYMINLLNVSSNENALITEADGDEYLLCLTDNDPNQICHGNINEMQNNGVIRDCLLPNLCANQYATYSVAAQTKKKSNTFKTPSTWSRRTSSSYSSHRRSSSAVSSKKKLCSKPDNYDFVILMDNSCGLRDVDCGQYLDGINKIISKLKDNYLNKIRISLIEFGSNKYDINILIDFKSKLQTQNIVRYTNFVKNEADCTQNAISDQTDLANALITASKQFDDDNNNIKKIIIVSSCMDNRDYLFCDDMNRFFTENHIDIHIINIIKSSYSSNSIDSITADQYLQCLTNDDKICVASGSNPGVNKNEFNDIINHCLLAQICSTHHSEDVLQMNQRHSRKRWQN